jgi:hypothetical protein
MGIANHAMYLVINIVTGLGFRIGEGRKVILGIQCHLHNGQLAAAMG